MHSVKDELARPGADRAERGPLLRAVADEERPRHAGIEPPFGPVTVLATTAWFGLVTGFLELGILSIWHATASFSVLGLLQLNRHFYWMIPVSHLTVFLVCGLPMAIVARLQPVFARRAVTFFGCTLAIAALLLMIRGLYAGASAVLAVGLAYRLTPLFESHDLAFRRIRRYSLPALFGGLAILGAHAYDRLVLEEQRVSAALPAASPAAPNVLLIVLDTVRADRLSLYGYDRNTTPNLERLRRGVVFGEARSVAPWTLPSHASLFTGRWPHELSVSSDRPLDATYPTLAEFLAKHGYATAGFVGNTYFCNSWFGLARGFVHYEDYFEQSIIVSPGEAMRSTALGRWLIRLVGTAYNVRPDTANTPKNGARVNLDFLAWLAANRERPFFAFLNYIDSHDPYLLPPGFDRHFGLKPESAADIATIRGWHSRRKSPVTERDITLIRDAYDDCLASLDEQLGHLFDTLEQSGVLQNTWVILTADHGEQLGEHTFYGHGKSLYRRELHVPLLVFGPSDVPQGRSIADPVSLRDVASTIVERLGLASDSPFPGRSLARFWQPLADTPPTADDVVMSEAAVTTRVSKHHKDWPPAMRGPMVSLRAEGMVYIRDSAGREQLFELASDPEEVKNLVGEASVQPVLERCRLTLERRDTGVAARR